MINHDKETLRDMALSLRQMTELQTPHCEYGHDFRKQFEDNIGYDNLGSVAFYWPIIGEADSREIIKEYLKRGGTVCLPVAHKSEKYMPFYQWTLDTVLIQGFYGILEPDPKTTQCIIPDTLIVPLVLFDGRGHRIGYGGGHYDATLAELRQKNPNLKAYGIAYDDQYSDNQWEINEFDQKLDAVFTQTRFYGFSNEA